MTVDRSIPPVSMHSVWLAARMARGQASSRVERTPLGVNMPGATSPVTTYRSSRTPVEGDGRAVDQRLAPVPDGRVGHGGGHLALRGIWSRPPIITTTMMMTPRATSA